MSFPDFDCEWDDELPTILQVLEGIEVEGIPDIYSERETGNYIPIVPEISEANQFLGLRPILEATEKLTAEMQSADHESAGMRVVQYTPLSTSSTTLHNVTGYFENVSPSSSSSTSRPDINPTTETKFRVAVDESLLVEYPVRVRVKKSTEDIAACTGTPKLDLDAKIATDKDSHETDTKLLKGALRKGSGNYRKVDAEVEVVETKARVTDKTDKTSEVAEVADSAVEVQGDSTQGVRL